MKLFIRSKNKGTNTSRNQTVRSNTALKAEQSAVSPFIAWVDGLFVVQRNVSIPVRYV